MITPTVGRIVHYHHRNNDGPLAAIVTWVHSDRVVNLTVFDQAGIPCGVTEVRLRQPDDEDGGALFWCEWMPYQVKKATGSESGEQEAGTQAI